MSSSLTLPRHSLANDLWMGEQLSALRGLGHEATFADDTGVHAGCGIAARAFVA